MLQEAAVLAVVRKEIFRDPGTRTCIFSQEIDYQSPHLGYPLQHMNRFKHDSSSPNSDLLDASLPSTKAQTWHGQKHDETSRDIYTA